MRIPAIIALITLFACGFASANDPDQAICAQQVQAIIGKLNVLYAKQQAPLVPFDSAQLSCDKGNSTFWKTPHYDCSFPSGDSIECLPEKRQIVGYYKSNPDIFTDKEPKPQLTLEQAAEEAKPWLRALMGDLPLYLAPPRGTFSSNMRDAHRFYSGKWQIRWPRMDSQGHLFEFDNLSASFSERFGLIGFGNNFHSTYGEPLGKPISMKDALAVARPAAEDWLKNEMHVSGIGSGWRLGPVQAELWVVNPNNFFQVEKMDQMVNNPNARLAWKCDFPLVSEKPLSQFERPQTLVVKIDALTKEVIGGDYRPIGKKTDGTK